MGNLNKTQVLAHIKKMCPHFDPNMIYIGPVKTIGMADIVIIVDGKLKILQNYWQSPKILDRLMVKLDEYFVTGEWDNSVYYFFKFDSQVPEHLRGIWRYINEEKMWEHLKSVRDTYPDCGVEEIGKPHIGMKIKEYE